MAKKKRERYESDADTDVNLTPMIDVVFNLIIFFMVITDMSQKDLEYLILPKADNATTDRGEDKDRIIVNVIDMTSANNKARIANGEIDPNLPPVMVQGRQVKDMDYLRKYLRKLANPRLYPDKEKGEVAPGIWPSSKPLLVRCDQGQVFGWVQSVMQFCTFVPGRPQEQELKESPLIYKLEIAVAEPPEFE